MLLYDTLVESCNILLVCKHRKFRQHHEVGLAIYMGFISFSDWGRGDLAPSLPAAEAAAEPAQEAKEGVALGHWHCNNFPDRDGIKQNIRR